MKTRKMLAAVMAILCMTGAMPAMTSSASYDPRDVNHDGAVSILDVIAINQHLAGTKYYLEYNQLDANQSHTVDYADSTCVLNATINASYSACYIRQYGNGYMQPVTMPAVSSTISLDNSADDTQGRWYIGYSYLDKADILPYQLVPTTMSLNSSQNTRDNVGLIDGVDDRVVAHGYENTGIVCLGDGGTGFIVGDHEIATAAHCVHTDGKIRTDVVVRRYDRTGERIETPLTVAEIHVPQDYTTATSELDYALITVVEDLSSYVQFAIGNSYNMTNSEAGNIPLHITGQPDNVGDNLEIPNSNHTLYTDHGSIYGSDNKTFLHCTVDVSGGQSGAPMYTITRERYNNTDYYTYTALGIITSKSTYRNRGTLMTQYHLQFYGGNPNANYQ